MSLSEEEEVSMEAQPMVIEVKSNERSGFKGRPRSGRSRSARSQSARSHRSYHGADNHSDEDYGSDFDGDNGTDDDEDDDEEEVSPRMTSRSAHNHRVKGHNGRRRVNMTPPDSLLKSASKKADKFLERGKTDKGIHELIRCIALTRIVYGAGDWRLAKAHAELADAYLDHKGYAAQADFHADNGKTILLNSPPTITTENEKARVYTVLFRLYYTKGRALIILKKFPDADQMLSKAEKFLGDLLKLSCVTEDECDEMEIDLSHAKARMLRLLVADFVVLPQQMTVPADIDIPHDNIVLTPNQSPLYRLYWKQKKHAVASSQYDKLLETMQTRYGKDSMELVPVFQEAGQLEQSKGRYADHDKAINMYLQAHSIAGANYREENIVLVDTALNLARAYSQTGREEAEDVAEKYLNECLATCQTVHGTNHKKTLEVMDELSRLLIRIDRQQEALGILRSSLPGKCEMYGDYSEQVSDTYKLIASVHLSEGSTEKALKSYKKCHNIECLVLGKNHKKSKDTERTMDILMASPSVASRISLSKEDELKKRPKFNAIVNRSKPVGSYNS